jgi:hypothetical protein
MDDEKHVYYLWAPRAIEDIEGNPHVRFIDGSEVDIERDIPQILMSERDCINAPTWGSSARARIERNIQRTHLEKGEFVDQFRWGLNLVLPSLKKDEAFFLGSVRDADNYLKRLIEQGKINGEDYDMQDLINDEKDNTKKKRIYKIVGDHAADSDDGVEVATIGYERMRYAENHGEKYTILDIWMDRPNDGIKPIYISVFRGYTKWFLKGSSQEGTPLTDNEIDVMKQHLTEAFKVIGRDIVIEVL